MNKSTKNSQKPQKLWFKAKHYGWGWYPCSWEGWLIIVLFLAIFLPVMRLMTNSNSLMWAASGFLIIGILIIILLIICYKKGEKPGWRWGKK
jgi:RsiW-degrading membrane proteinase PrsW (M82 family)